MATAASLTFLDLSFDACARVALALPTSPDRQHNPPGSWGRRPPRRVRPGAPCPAERGAKADDISQNFPVLCNCSQTFQGGLSGCLESCLKGFQLLTVRGSLRASGACGYRMPGTLSEILATRPSTSAFSSAAIASRGEQNTRREALKGENSCWNRSFHSRSGCLQLEAVSSRLFSQLSISCRAVLQCTERFAQPHWLIAAPAAE